MQKNLTAGLILTMVIMVIIVVIWVKEPARIAAGAERQEARSIERGAVLFESYCAGCHGLRGEGVPGLTPPLNVEDLWAGRADIQFYGTLHDYLYLTTAAGHTKFGMPAWADDYGGPLRNDQIEDLVRFVMNWQGPQPKEVRPEVTPTPQRAPAAEVPAPSREADPANGAALFNNWCAACHGPTGDGTNLGPPIDRAGVLAKDDEFLRDITREGIPGTSMIAFKSRLAAQEIKDVVAFMRTWKPREPAAPGEGDPARGATLYLGNCAPCHGINGEGDALGPPLNLTDVLVKEDDFLRTITLEGIPGTAMIDFGTRMSPQDIDDIIAFMRTWQPKGQPRTGEAGVIHGAQVYASTCAACHGSEGEGTAIGPILNRQDLLAKGDDYLRDITREGIPGTSMLSFKDRLTVQEIEDVVAFMRSWEAGASQKTHTPTPEPTLTPSLTATPELALPTPTARGLGLPTATPELALGDAESGAALYAKSCAMCHGDSGEGKVVKEKLNTEEFLTTHDDEAIFETITGGVEGKMPPFAEAHGGTLTEAEIWDVVAFIRSWQK